MTHTRWPAPDPELVRYIDEWQSVVPRVYREDSKLLEEHVRQESSFRTSGYSRRQVTELVQNAADAIYKSGTRGKIELVLTEDHLYCANDGKAFERAGVEAITHAYLSDKRGGEIGRYGLGFKSVLAVSENPQIFSRSASFQFGSPAAREVLKTLDTVEGDTPVLRLATPLDYTVAAEHDNVLRQLGAWATTIVRLPLSRDAGLVEQLREFQTQFLIFTPPRGGSDDLDPSWGRGRDPRAHLPRPGELVLRAEGPTARETAMVDFHHGAPAVPCRAGGSG